MTTIKPHLKRALERAGGTVDGTPPGESLEARTGALLRSENLPRVLSAGARIPLLVEVLTKQGTLDGAALAHAEEQAARAGVDLKEFLLRTGLVSPREMALALAEQHDLAFIDLSLEEPDPRLLQKFEISWLLRLRILPLEEKDEHLVVALDDPGDLPRRDEISEVYRGRVSVKVAATDHLMGRLNAIIDTALSVDQRASLAELARSPDTPDRAQSAGRDAGHVVGLLDDILSRAIRKRASDIHLEPYPGTFKAKIRLEGMLREIAELDPRLADPLISRIKVLARMDITEKRVPQDGRIQMSLDGRSVALRVSTMPSIHGETVVLRILDRSGLGLDLERLGMAPEQMIAFKQAIHKPYGLVLVAGPTGSGKTTTLYSAVRAIHQPQSKLITVEDPVEYQLPDVIQVAVNEKQGLTFATGLRAIVRQDPDTILIGEIRDADTAIIAINAALTGHLVLSTIHANDVLEAVPRLVALGVQRRDFVSSLNLILSQRLIRRLCTSCQKRTEVIPLALREITEDVDRFVKPGTVLAFPGGCALCDMMGYTNRFGIYELLPLTMDVRELFVQEATAAAIRRVVTGKGARTLRQMGWDSVLAAKTGIEELNRVTLADT